MKNSKITFTSLMILGLLFSLNLGCQSELDEVVDIEIIEENLTANLYDSDINMNTENGHGLTYLSEACVGCHQGSNRTLSFEISANETEVTPQEIMISYYENYVSNHTQESAELNGIDIEGVKDYITKYK